MLLGLTAITRSFLALSSIDFFSPLIFIGQWETVTFLLGILKFTSPFMGNLNFIYFFFWRPALATEREGNKCAQQHQKTVREFICYKEWCIRQRCHGKQFFQNDVRKRCWICNRIWKQSMLSRELWGINKFSDVFVRAKKVLWLDILYKKMGLLSPRRLFSE